MKISEVSKTCDISSDTLRYYERIGLLPPVNRTRGRIREYHEHDVRRIEFVKCMRSAGLPLEMLIEYFKLLEQGDQTIEARKEMLKEQRDVLASRIAELQKTLNLLDYKIAVYDSAVLHAEQAIVQPKE